MIANWFDNPERLDAYRRVRIEEGGDPAHVAEYLDKLVAHIRYVQEAGQKLGVETGQLLNHDVSKWTDQEFLAAAENWQGGSPNPDRYARAWLHHIHHNPHHWQHWIFPDGFIPKGSSVENGVMEMPRQYAREMVADWMGSSMAYTGSWEMSAWLAENMPRIRLHSRTADYVRELLAYLNYPDELYMQRWAHEIDQNAQDEWLPRIHYGRERISAEVEHVEPRFSFRDEHTGSETD